MNKIVLILISTLMIYANGSITGDFNGDGAKESVSTIFKNCKNDIDFQICDCFLKFSNHKIKSFNIGECDGGGVGADLLNEGDLNGDGADEIGLMRHWPTSAWRAYEIFNVKNKPKKVFGMSLFIGGEIESIYQADLVRKNPSKKGYVQYRFFGITDHNGDNIDFDGKTWKSGKLQ
ncbi:MAG: hypothetical protein PHI79_00295 [Sulfurovaceae bacterium]|nr:hypothetical protein [Sulfurovaceae bacterium]MDD5548018.1 hypothetical protein [Sulfurovaceae bacterium]